MDELPTATNATSGTMRQLRASLRLCFGPERADALAAMAEVDRDPVRRLGPIVRRARLRFTADRWLARLPIRRGTPAPGPPLGRRPGLSAAAALALALHLGLALDAETLGQLLDRSPEQVGLALGQARRAVDPALPAPCREFAAAVGRYGDPLDPLEGAPLLRHLEGCARCRAALEGARAVDDALLAEIERSATALPDEPERRRTRRLRPALGGMAVVLVVLALVVAILAGANRLLAPAHHPVPLLPASAPGILRRGWLLESGQDGEVEAIELATGARRVVISGQPNSAGDYPSVLVSPDHQRIAVIDARPPVNVSLWVYTIDGRLVHSWDPLLAHADGGVVGWLNADELLVRRDNVHDIGQTATQGELFSLDVRTGAQRVLLDQIVDTAVAAPNGQQVAILRSGSNGAATLELRPLHDGRLGPPTATFARGPYPVWTPDSQRVVFAVTPATPMTGKYAIDTLSLNGQLTTVARLPSSQPTETGGSASLYYVVEGVTPDGTRVVYDQGTSAVGGYVWSSWELPLTGGPPRQLASSDLGMPGLGPRVVWSPDKTAMALTVPEAPRTVAETSSPLGIYATLAFDPMGRPLGGLLDQYSDAPLLAWLPETALSAATTAYAPAPRPGPFQPDRVVPTLSPQPALTADSRLSPDGTQALIVDHSYNFALTVPLNTSPPAPVIAGPPDDTSWLPGGSGAIGVQPQSTGGGTSSQIEIYVQGQTYPGVAGAPAIFDPARLNGSATARYARPLVAPDGLNYSFFVVDGRAVALWLGGRSAPPVVVARWTLPPGARATPPLVASWVSSDALVFSEPEDWADGLPQRVTIERLTVMPDHTTTVTPLVGWHAQGGEQGIALQELRRAPDGTRLAVRLRHYTGTNPATERFDAILVLPASDLTQGVELARGGAGSGLSWSPGGGELVAALDGRLEVLSADGREVERVPTGNGTVSYPLWVRTNTIWYEAGSGASAQVRQVVR